MRDERHFLRLSERRNDSWQHGGAGAAVSGADWQLRLAPLEIGLFFFGSVQLFFIGIVGEYIGAIHTQVQKRPLVVELERINFDSDTVKGFSSP